MDQVIPGLWIGDLPSAKNTELLKAHNIYSILSAMRGRITINETFIRHQILLDDSNDADILVHLVPSIHFIQAELDKGRGVLVHCQAGVSRSATIVAAYLMYSLDLDPSSALEMIKKVRPSIEYCFPPPPRPNQNFLQQLEIFHKAHYNISRKDKSTRMFYLERTMQDLLNGDGSQVETDMFAKFPDSPGGRRRRIRCKMCRQELATREHMLDHGQLGPPTPAALSPATSRRPSANQVVTSRRPSAPQARSRNGSSSDSRARRLSLLGLGGPLLMSTLDSEHAIIDDDADHITPTPSLSHLKPSGTKTPPSLPQITEVAKEVTGPPTNELGSQEESSQGREESAESSANHVVDIQTRMETAKLIGRRLSNTILTSPSQGSTDGAPEKPPMTSFISANDLAAQLYSNPKLAALRSPAGASPSRINMSPTSPPILMNPKCSGYFLEPMDWMEPFLETGEIAGKIVCPNKKCGVKLGNYDWAGVKCGCKEWVVPGFCINRSKVDEIVT